MPETMNRIHAGRFRVVIWWPIGVVSVSQPRNLVTALQESGHLRSRLAGRADVTICPDCRLYRENPAPLDPEDVLGPDVAPLKIDGPPPQLIASQEHLAAALAEEERLLRENVARQVGWPLERMLWLAAGLIVWGWWRWQRLCVWLYGEEEGGR